MEDSCFYIIILSNEHKPVKTLILDLPHLHCHEYGVAVVVVGGGYQLPTHLQNQLNKQKQNLTQATPVKRMSSTGNEIYAY